MEQSDAIRYSRQIILKEIGIEGQNLLARSKVLVVGAGGLGAPVLQYLASAGIGTIGIVDDDFVEASNLARQVIYSPGDIGLPKAHCAKQYLEKLNPSIKINVYQLRVNSDNALSIIKDYDIVVDGSDNFPTKYLINDACTILNKPWVYGSIFRFEGQISLFNYSPDKERAHNYRDLYPTPPPPEMIPSCPEGGVVGSLAGMVGSIQATEVIKFITKAGSTLSGRLLVIDTLSFDFRTIKFPVNRNQNLPTTLIDYETYCETMFSFSSVKEMSVSELEQLRQSGEKYQLVDVREPFEVDIATIGGDLIPQGQVLDKVDNISRDGKVVVYCRSGKRSANVIRLLEKRFDFENLYNLKGGILEWSEKIDSSIQKY